MPSKSTNPLNHALAVGIERVGFRKWYERELLSSHAHMVLTVLCTVGLLGSFEAMRGASEGDRAMNVILVLLCAAIGLWALRRYLFLLTRAEDVANQANCGSCGEYGRFKVVGTRADATDVCCSKCRHCWTIASEA
ncbi:hypothetical protein FN976_03840 [Caenimonas sedimenti]|uniref:Uncharacterized protein n=1 Tax=Caenimonas sedimenti TaxID=2596921 RepID=A0A562ZVN9_9BURK|nr:hypothetical protein [Caenimonas sedimenti]TWO72672.1 hypothetical protein FN976_03840 [Caenimonas sedimenti]